MMLVNLFGNQRQHIIKTFEYEKGANTNKGLKPNTTNYLKVFRGCEIFNIIQILPIHIQVSKNKKLLKTVKYTHYL